MLFYSYTIIQYKGITLQILQCQKSTAQSLIEAKIIAANKGAKEAAQLKKITLNLNKNP